ncbi:alpha/beta hydrolase [Asanoa sp. NPDC050611]|uniref:alpha/beta fold hydrolase n=1 Tax=Asanoa sp. NPDC050611 TaxID=3157098 RepID=UPI0033D7DE44
METIQTSAGPIAYTDSGGSGPTIVFLHGMLMDGSLWDQTVAALAADHRCVVPTLPMGAHQLPAKADADLSLPGLARLVEELLAALDLRDVTLVGNDTGGALAQLVVAGSPARVSRVALASCEAFDNVPPGLTGRTLAYTGMLPPTLFGLFMSQMRIRALRRLPVAFGWLTKRGDAATARWVRPVLRDAAIRRDATRMLRAIRADRDVLNRLAVPRLSSFAGPALVIWASADRVMPPEHGRRLASLLPQGRLVEVDDTATLIPLDQPDVFATTVADFIRADELTHRG